MKKSILFPILALGLAAVSCDDFDFPNPPAQSNEQLPIVGVDANVNITPANTAAINLDALNAANKGAVLGAFTDAENFDAEAYNFSFVAQVAADEAFSNCKDAEATMVGNNIVVAPDVLDGLFHEFYPTLDPAAKDMYVRYKAYATEKISGTKYRIGGTEATYGAAKFSFVPFNPGFTVEDEYYIIGTATDGAINSKAIKMTNSGVSPYDDPQFTALVELTADQLAAGYNWAVVPASTLAAGSGLVYVPTAEYVGESASGVFEQATSTGMWNTVYGNPGYYQFKFNAKPDKNGQYAFSVGMALEHLYIVGNGNGWNIAGANVMYTDDYAKYWGYAYLDGGYKFSCAPDWDHGDYGKGAEEGTLAFKGGDLNESVAGAYWCTANLGNLTYANTLIEHYAIIGDATPGGWDAETVMTSEEKGMVWKLTTDLKDGTFKFRANNGWDINLGGALVELTPGGDNIAVTAGKYEITLDLRTSPISAKMDPK